MMEETKECSSCGKTKPLSAFLPVISDESRKMPRCEECYRIARRRANKKYCDANPEKVKERGRLRREQYPEYHRNYCRNNKERLAEYGRRRYKENKEVDLQRSKEWVLRNPEKANQYKQRWREKNKHYHRDRKLKDPVYKLRCDIPKLITQSFRSRGFAKDSKTHDIIGCTFSYLVEHLKSQFTDGMCLENHGEWQVDHIIPLSIAETEEDIVRLNHYTNLQPLSQFDNSSKNNKVYLDLIEHKELLPLYESVTEGRDIPANLIRYDWFSET